MANGSDNGITISGRLVERILLGVLVVAVGGNTVIGGVARTNAVQDSKERDRTICNEVQNVRDEIAGLVEPFLDLSAAQPGAEDRAGEAILRRFVVRLRTPHRCP